MNPRVEVACRSGTASTTSRSHSGTSSLPRLTARPHPRPRFIGAALLRPSGSRAPTTSPGPPAPGRPSLTRTAAQVRILTPSAPAVAAVVEARQPGGAEPARRRRRVGREDDVRAQVRDFLSSEYVSSFSQFQLSSGLQEEWDGGVVPSSPGREKIALVAVDVPVEELDDAVAAAQADAMSAPAVTYPRAVRAWKPSTAREIHPASSR